MVTSHLFFLCAQVIVVNFFFVQRVALTKEWKVTTFPHSCIFSSKKKEKHQLSFGFAHKIRLCFWKHSYRKGFAMDTIIYSQYFSVRRFNLCGAQHTPKELAWYATSRNRDLDFGNHLSDGDVRPSNVFAWSVSTSAFSLSLSLLLKTRNPLLWTAVVELISQAFKGKFNWPFPLWQRPIWRTVANLGSTLVRIICFRNWTKGA